MTIRKRKAKVNRTSADSRCLHWPDLYKTCRFFTGHAGSSHEASLSRRPSSVQGGASLLLRCQPVRSPFRIPAPGSRLFDVAGFGLNSIDLVAVVDEHPESDTKQRLRRFARLPGGQIATALTVCAKLGWTAHYIGSFGDDLFGQLSQDSLTGAGVDISGSTPA